jgi:hypothetical protein
LDFIKIYSKSSGSTTTYNCTLYALDDLHLEHTFNTLQSTTIKLYKLQSIPIFNGSKATRTSKHNAPEDITDAASHALPTTTLTKSAA